MSAPRLKSHEESNLLPVAPTRGPEFHPIPATARRWWCVLRPRRRVDGRWVVAFERVGRRTGRGGHLGVSPWRGGATPCGGTTVTTVTTKAVQHGHKQGGVAVFFAPLLSARVNAPAVANNEHDRFRHGGAVCRGSAERTSASFVDNAYHALLHRLS